MSAMYGLDTSDGLCGSPESGEEVEEEASWSDEEEGLPFGPPPCKASARIVPYVCQGDARARGARAA